MTQTLAITSTLPLSQNIFPSKVHNKHSHHLTENAISNFPLNNLFKQIEPKTTLESFGKQLLIMSSNLLPALSVSETLDTAGDSIGRETLFDFLKPVGAIITRQGLVDGINKNNYYKTIAASISALGLLSANRLWGLPRFLLRPVLAVFLFGIEEYKSIKKLLGASNHKHSHCHDKSCNHDHHDSDAKELKTTHTDHISSWGKLATGLGILEIQLNTVAPIVSKLSSKLFHEINPMTRIGKVLFNTLFLSLGFVGLGEGLKYGVQRFSKSQTSWLKDLAGNIEATICPCCGTTGACANAVAEDVTATANIY